jgi:hypothetical protein
MFAGCSGLRDFSLQPLPENTSGKYTLCAWTALNKDRYLYQASVNVMGHNLSGLMIIKPYSLEHHRLFFLTKTGIKILDMELLENDGFILHYCLESLKRRTLIRTLKNDIRLMLSCLPDEIHNKVFTEKGSGRKTVRVKENGGKIWVFIDSETCRPEELIQYRCGRKKVGISYFGNNPEAIDSIKIKHYNINLNIHLNQINEIQPATAE